MFSTEVTKVVSLGLLGSLGLALAVRAVVLCRRSSLTPVQWVLYGMNYLLMRIRWRARAHGRLSITPGQGAVIVCNHRCPADSSFPYLLTGRVVHWMVAQEYCGLPVIGWFLRACHVIPVRRGGIDTAAVKRAVRYAREGGLVGVFPEGRINKTDEFLLAGRGGAAMIAMKARVPVVPCYIDGAPYDGTTLGCLLMAANVRLTVGSPIDVTGYIEEDAGRRGIDDLTRRMLREIARLGGRPDFEPKLAGRVRR